MESDKIYEVVNKLRGAIAIELTLIFEDCNVTDEKEQITATTSTFTLLLQDILKEVNNKYGRNTATELLGKTVVLLSQELQPNGN